MKNYPAYYCLRYYGPLLRGPKAGVRLDGYVLAHLGIGGRRSVAADQALQEDLKAWKARALQDAQEHPGLYVEVCTRQFQDSRRKADRKFHYTVLESYIVEGFTPPAGSLL
jgi:hypothetical protein